MKTKNLDVYFIQETWLEDDVFDETINGYHVFRHNGSKGNHNFRGVAIILSPRYYDGWKAAGAKPPLTTDATSEFAGRFISINITLKSFDRRKKQVRGKKGSKHLALALASVYHPCTKTGADEVYIRFLDTLDTLLGKIPTGTAIIMGADVNANIGKLDNLTPTEFQSTLGPYGFSKRNTKGEGLLTLYLAHSLRVTNTFFECKADGPGYGTWSSNRPTTTGTPDSHMLDLIVCSTTLHKRIRNCQVVNDGADSDHRAVRMQLNLTSLKYKEKASIKCGDINWREICDDDQLRKLYNKYLLELTSHDMTYNNFCEAVTRAGRQTAVSIESKCEGWYKASESVLIPAIEEKNDYVTDYKTNSSLMTNLLTFIANSSKSTNEIVTLLTSPKHVGIVAFAPIFIIIIIILLINIRG
jgi:exonuclease III